MPVVSCDNSTCRRARFKLGERLSLDARIDHGVSLSIFALGAASRGVDFSPDTETAVRRAPFLGLVGPAFIAVIVAAPPTLSAQAPASTQASAPASMGKEEITAFAKVQVAIGAAHDSIDAQLAAARNKTGQAQTQLQEKLRAQIAEILHHNGMSEEDYRRKTYAVSTNPEIRKAFDGAVAQLTGVPTPGQVPVTAASRPPITNLPAGAVGVHVGHVVNAFGDTPGGQGFLPVAMADARVAAQHAALATRSPSNLDAMKLHAGHVINALDPSLVAAGPGSGYGVKKAATGVGAHIDLAAKAPGASANVVMHANHIATCAKNTVTRADQIIALAQQVQAATDPAAAATLISQIVSLSNQLTAGFDTNGDGRITWEEGGLQQAEEHVNLMLSAEPKAPF